MVLASRVVPVLLSLSIFTIGGCANRAHDSGDATSPGLANQNVSLSSTQPSAGESTPVQPAMNSGNDIVARVNGKPILMRELMQPLIDSYGLNFLLNLVQLELAKQDAAKKGITISPEDIKQERDDTLVHMFKDATKSDYDQLLEQFLQQQHLSKSEFQIVIETNAYLRRIAEPALRGRITDDALQEAFRAQYGETVKVRYIQCSNLQEIAEAKRRLGAGEPFDKVARELSRDQRTAGLGGELPRFSRDTQGLPQTFKDAAFALKVGEVSDPVQASGAYHLIKLEQRFEPKAVKFDDVKESIRVDLQDRLLQQAIKELRAQLAQQAMATMKIEEPSLRKQFAARMDKHEAEIRDREQIRQQLEKERKAITTQQAMPETRPTTVPSPAPITTPTPTSAPTPAQAVPPPATKPTH